jgi:hypothetical protein
VVAKDANTDGEKEKERQESAPKAFGAATRQGRWNSRKGNVSHELMFAATGKEVEEKGNIGHELTFVATGLVRGVDGKGARRVANNLPGMGGLPDSRAQSRR